MGLFVLAWRSQTCSVWPRGACWITGLRGFCHPCRFWRQMGGHLRIIEANSRGVVWGIGYDHTAWVYTGGYGGGCFQGEGDSEHPRLARPAPNTRRV